MSKMENLVEYMNRSQFRVKVLKRLTRTATTASKISSKTRLNVRTVRSVIRDLRDKKLVKKAVRGKAKPMIYEASKLGEKVAQLRTSRGKLKLS